MWDGFGRQLSSANKKDERARKENFHLHPSPQRISFRDLWTFNFGQKQLSAITYSKKSVG